MARLEQIEKYHEEALDCLHKDNMYEYFLSQAELDITGERLKSLQSEEKAEEYRLEETKRELKSATEEKEQKQEIETALRVELKQKAEFRALEEQKKELDKLKDREQ